ncbi:unnamed protein product [Effrenium voratum]|nr:unnamed protein product [Effrenium voratum]
MIRPGPALELQSFLDYNLDIKGSDGDSAAVSTAAPKKRRVLRWTGLDEEIFEVWAPAVANLILLPLVGSIDLFWIGQSRDPLAIAGMGAANQVYSTIYFLISFLPAVITPRIAEEIARERRDKAAQWVSEALGFACLMGFFGMLVLVLCPHTVLRLITNSPQVLAEAVPYCRIRGVSLIATLCSSVSFATFRGLLDFRTPLRVSLSANLLNALLNPLLMFTLGLGVSGVAAATTIAEIYSAVTFVLLLRSRKMLSRKPAIPAAETVRSLLQTGLAVQVRSVSTNLMFLLAVRRVTAIDPSGVQAAAYQVTQQFWNLAGYVSLALSSSGAGLVPTKYWKKGGGINEARQLADRLYLWGCGLGLVLSLLQLLALPLVSLMAPIKEVQQAARTPAILAAFLQLLNGAVFAGEGMLLGLRAFPVLAASSLFGCGLMVTSLYLAGDRALIGDSGWGSSCSTSPGSPHR